MDRRKFMNKAAAIAAASFTADMTLSQRAEAFEGVMIEGLPYHVGQPVICEPDRERSMAAPGSRIGGGGAPSKPAKKATKQKAATQVVDGADQPSKRTRRTKGAAM